MPKPVIKVSTKQAVELIRSGASDTVLMNTFGLTFTGLLKLFKKLVDADEIRQSELDSRAIDVYLPQTVSVSRVLDEISRDAEKSANRVYLELPDIDSDNTERLSTIERQSLLKRLGSANQTTQFQNYHRRAAYEPVTRGTHALGAREYSLPEDDPWHRNRRKWTLSRFIQEHKVIIAGFLGGIVGMAAMAVGFFLFVGLEKVPALPQKSLVRATPSPDVARGDADKQVQEALAILEAIARDRNDPTKSGAIAWGVTDLEDCLNNCRRSYSETDETGRLELSNCRKECLQTHSDLFRRIRERYHAPTE